LNAGQIEGGDPGLGIVGRQCVQVLREMHIPELRCNCHAVRHVHCFHHGGSPLRSGML